MEGCFYAKEADADSIDGAVRTVEAGLGREVVRGRF
jgi:hypothetical protein